MSVFKWYMFQCVVMETSLMPREISIAGLLIDGSQKPCTKFRFEKSVFACVTCGFTVGAVMFIVKLRSLTPLK